MYNGRKQFNYFFHLLIDFMFISISAITLKVVNLG